MKKALIPILLFFTGFIIGIRVIKEEEIKKTDKAKLMSDKHLALFLLMNKWFGFKQEGKSLVNYMKDNSYNTIAIYGMSYVGKTLLKELRDSEIIIKYGIDKKAGQIDSDIEIVSPDDLLRDVDAIIVTSVFFMDEIEDMLSGKVTCPIISLEDILYDMEIN